MPNEATTPSVHTPGPWFADPGHQGDQRFYITAREQPGLIATFHHKHNELEVAANARLSAAAPDMLAALKAYRGQYLNDRGTWPDDEAETLALAEAAIAKAEGR